MAVGRRFCISIGNLATSTWKTALGAGAMKGLIPTTLTEISQITSRLSSVISGSSLRRQSRRRLAAA